MNDLSPTNRARKPRWMLGLAAVSVALLGWGSEFQARAIDLGNIMPLGDSITDGQGAAGGYRDPLYTDLTNAGYTFNFVGSTSDNSTALLNNAGQSHHEGHSGYVIQSTDSNIPNASSSGRPGIEDNIAGYLSSIGPSAQPNYFLLMIGTNDMDINYYAADAPTRLNQLIAKILNPQTGLDPGANLILAMITPTGSAADNSRIQTYNASMAALVQQDDALGEKVSLVDMYDALSFPSDFTDTLHPNQSGYDKMAAVWTAGINAVAAPEPNPLVFVIAGMGLLVAFRWSPRRLVVS